MVFSWNKVFGHSKTAGSDNAEFGKILQSVLAASTPFCTKCAACRHLLMKALFLKYAHNVQNAQFFLHKTHFKHKIVSRFVLVLVLVFLFYDSGGINVEQ